MTGLSAGPIEALEAALRSLSRLGDLRGARPVAAVRRISGPALVVGPGGNRLIRRAIRRRHHRPFVRCTCPRPAHRKTDQRPRRDH